MLRTGGVGGDRDSGGRVLQREEETKRFVDSLHLGGVEAAARVGQSLAIHHGRLLDQDARLRSKHSDRGPKRSRPCAGGDRHDQRRTQSQQLVGLHDDGIASPAARTTSSAATLASSSRT